MSTSTAGRLYCRLARARKDPSGEECRLLREGGRYNDVLEFPNELWQDERGDGARLPLCCDVGSTEVEFDWFSRMKLAGGKAPAWAAGADPNSAKVATSYEAPIGGDAAVGCINSVQVKLFEVRRDALGFPCSPRASVGVRGRGVLGQWGPNHAGDAILTRAHPETGKLQVALIERRDGSGQFAFPGGFVDPGEFTAPLKTVIREFLEEAVGRDGITKNSFEALRQTFGHFEWNADTGEVVIDAEKTKWGKLAFAGYVDDERNTDNAWIETIALWWHLESEAARMLRLTAGDDAKAGSAAFYDVEGDTKLKSRGVDPLVNLFASHSYILKKVLALHEPPQ